MKNLKIALLAMVLIFSQGMSSYAAPKDVITGSEISKGIIYDGPVALRTRGTLDDLCRAGFKQYCPENRKKYNRPMTKAEIECAVSLGVATYDTLESGSAWSALFYYGSAIVGCIL